MVAVNKAFFQNEAKGLIGADGIFSEFRAACEFKKSGAFNYATQQSTVTAFSVPMIDIGVMQTPSQGKSIAANEIELIGLYSEFPQIPSVDNTRFTFGGKAYAISAITIGPAQATITIKGVI